ncbi:MAG: NAD(P)-dependent oxidoreductase [Marmoricola sp.]
MKPPKIAVLGTGIIGSGIAANLARAGLGVTVWNRTVSKAEGLGAQVADSPEEAAADADVVITVLSDADTVADVVRQAKPASGTVWVQSATVGVEGCTRLAELAEELDLVYVDAPVLGTKGPAQAGKLTVLASGPDSAQEVLTPVFEAVAARTLWLGAAGAGSRLKLVVNAWVLTTVEGAAESLALARGLGLDPQLFLDAVKDGPLDSTYLQTKGAAMLTGDLEPQFPLRGAVKDSRLIEQAGADAGVELALAPALREHFARAEAHGHGHQDMAATFLAH